MKSFFFILILLIAINNISYGFMNDKLKHQQKEQSTLFFKNESFSPKESNILINGLNFHSLFENIKDGNFYQRYRIYLLTISLILVGIFFFAFYSRMTQPPIKK